MSKLNEHLEKHIFRVKVADTFWSRLRGLLGHESPAAGEGLLLKNTSQVHTFGMSYPIDIVFLDRVYNVVDFQSLKPNRISRFFWSASDVLELCKGEIGRCNLRKGQTLNLIDKDTGASLRQEDS